MLKHNGARSGVVVSGGVHVRTLGCGRARRSVLHQTEPLVITCGAASDRSSNISGNVVLDHICVGRRHLLSGISSVLIWQASPVKPLAWATASAADVPGPHTPSPEVAKALDAVLDRVITKPKAAVALRLIFHDAGTYNMAAGNGGLNASIRFELDRPENKGLKRGWRLIEQMSEELKGTAAEGKASFSDLVALAGARAVSVCGGPVIPMTVGRVDATEASGDPTDRMPGETFNIDQLKASFLSKGLSIKEMVILSGAHTLGSKGFGDAVTFDNQYYVSLLKKPWLDPKESMASMIGLPSDHVLPDDEECLKYINVYAQDQALFFSDFTTAYGKLASLGSVWSA